MLLPLPEVTNTIVANGPAKYGLFVCGSNQRNSNCEVLACEDWTELRRSLWSGYRTMSYTRRYSSMWTDGGCRKGTYNYKKRHDASHLVAANNGVTVGGWGLQVAKQQWVHYPGDSQSPSVRITCKYTVKQFAVRGLESRFG